MIQLLDEHIRNKCKPPKTEPITKRRKRIPVLGRTRGAGGAAGRPKPWRPVVTAVEAASGGRAGGSLRRVEVRRTGFVSVP